MGQKMIDIAHISFLDMINIIISQSGPANAKGVLIRNALSAAEKMTPCEFDSFESFLESVKKGQNPIALVEGKATHIEGGVFGLKNCPFAPSIKDYMEVFHGLPPGFDEITKEFNKGSMITSKYRIGEGAGVSPFCAVHQSLRSALGDRIKINGTPITVFQLGCKSGSGEKGLAQRWIDETGISEDLVSQVLEDHMCCYFIRCG